MSKRKSGVMALVLVLALVATACAAPTPTPVPPTPTKAPAKVLKVGVISDTGGFDDKSFNQSAKAGTEKAAKEFGFEARFLQSVQPADYEKNIDLFATEKFDVIITVGFLMGDATAKKAQQYPNIKFAIVDYAYFPEKAGDPDPYTTKLKNVTSLMFAEDEVGYLAGVVAGGMTKTGVVCSVSGMEIPPVVRFVVGYQNGAKSMRPDVKTLNVYIPDFNDTPKGKEVGLNMIAQGCDVVFGVGGKTGNGGLIAAKEKGLMAIGVDVDQYLTFPDVKDALVTSAMKNVDVAVYEYLKSVVQGTVKAGINLASVKNNGVGLAPFHDWENKVPQSVKDAVKKAEQGLRAGTLKTGYTP